MRVYEGASSVRSGVIGAGFIAGVHVNAVRAAGGRVSCVADVDEEAAMVAAARFGADSAAASAEELIASDLVDVVHVCTPNSTHARLAAMAIEYGKTVICEKPLATSVADARDLVAAADRRGVTTAVPFVYRFYSHVRAVRQRIARGEAGRVWLMHGSYLQDWLSRPQDSNWRVDPKMGGASRAFADIGVHWCDLMEFATGQRIKRVNAVAGVAYPERAGTEDAAALVFETDAGGMGTLVVSQVSPGRKNRLWFSFDGTDRSYSFDQEVPELLWVGGRDDNRLIVRDPNLDDEVSGRLSRLPAGHPQGYQEAFNSFIGDVYAAVAGEVRDGLPTFRDGLRAAEITDAVLQSAASRQWRNV